MKNLWQTKQQLEQINNQSMELQQPEAVTRHYRRTKGPKFEERHKRVTTYLENNLYQEIESLRERGLILNMTAMVNAAVREYIDKYHSTGNLQTGSN